MAKKITLELGIPSWIVHSLLLLLLLGISFFVRTYQITTPLADWHSWRQADTASVTREFIKHRYSIFQPHYHDLSNIPSGLDNVEGYRFVEFPLVNYGLAQLLIAFPQLDLVVTSRMASIFTSLATIILLYIFVYKIKKDPWISLLAAAWFGLLPYSIYYSRVILPEPFMVTTSILALVSFTYYLDSKSKNAWIWLVLTGISIGLALLLKPSAIFFFPVLIALAWHRYGFRAIQKPLLWLLLLGVVPLLWWRKYITAFPSGIPANAWLFNGNGIRFRPAWWRWLFADRLGRLILGYWGSSFLVSGIVSISQKLLSDQYNLVVATWSLGSLAYLAIFATGNVQHDYYQIQLVPILAVLMASGIVWIYQTAKKLNLSLILVSGLLITTTTFTLAFSWYEVKGYFNINNPAIVEAGKRVDALTPADAQVIAPYQGDTAFLFQTNRTGWPIGFDIDKKIQNGADFYVSTVYDTEARTLEKSYATLEKTDDYLIIDLTQPIAPPKP